MKIHTSTPLPTILIMQPKLNRRSEQALLQKASKMKAETISFCEAGGMTEEPAVPSPKRWRGHPGAQRDPQRPSNADLTKKKKNNSNSSQNELPMNPDLSQNDFTLIPN